MILLTNLDKIRLHLLFKAKDKKFTETKPLGQDHMMQMEQLLEIRLQHIEWVQVKELSSSAKKYQVSQVQEIMIKRMQLVKVGHNILSNQEMSLG